MQMSLFLLSICPLESTFARRNLFRILRVVLRLNSVSVLSLLSKSRLRWWVLNLSLLFIQVLPILLDLLRVFNIVYKGVFVSFMLRYSRRLSRIILPIFLIAFEFFYFLEGVGFLGLEGERGCLVGVGGQSEEMQDYSQWRVQAGEWLKLAMISADSSSACRKQEMGSQIEFVGSRLSCGLASAIYFQGWLVGGACPILP